MSSTHRRASHFAVVVLLLLPLLFFHRSLFLGEAFLPGDLLAQTLPYRTISPQTERKTTFWNVLRFDGIAQFYPWRLHAARSWRTGRVPLTNPYQFAGDRTEAGIGAPLLANSQSAPFYPPNLLFALFAGDASSFWYAFGLSAAIHLFVAAWGVYIFLRALNLPIVPSLFGATAFVFSAPVVCWLSLPTFLCVAAWFPWLLLLIRYAHAAPEARQRQLAAVGTGAVGGLMILAGHLQIALYGLLAGGLYALWLGAQQNHLQPLGSWGRWLSAVVAVFALAICLSAPQLLPALELSRNSHRAASGFPTMVQYDAYNANALPLRNLTAFLLPDFFGHPNAGNHWNDLPRGNNYGEWAAYVGVLPLLFALFAVALPFRKPKAEINDPNEIPSKDTHDRLFFLLLAALALLMAFGTPINLLFFFAVPGFSQTGNPARVLILFAFTMAILSAFGLSHAADATIPQSAKRRAALIAIVLPLILTALGANFALSWAQATYPQIAFAQLMQSTNNGGAVVGIALFGIGSALLAAMVLRKDETKTSPATLLSMLVLVVTFADLLAWGIGYNPTCPPRLIYPTTPGIAYLQTNAKDALIAFVNTRWSMTAQSPQTALLPPNAATVYELYDVAGYDSLMPKAYKDRARAVNNNEDPSPPENGNIVFCKSVEAAKRLGATYIVLPPASFTKTSKPLPYDGPDMQILENPAGTLASAARQGEGDLWPMSFRVGLLLGVLATLTIAGTCFASLAGANRGPRPASQKRAAP